MADTVFIIWATIFIAVKVENVSKTKNNIFAFCNEILLSDKSAFGIAFESVSIGKPRTAVDIKNSIRLSIELYLNPNICIIKPPKAEITKITDNTINEMMMKLQNDANIFFIFFKILT